MTDLHFPALCLTVSALEPAGPLFEDYEIDVRIDATDANYVDVIHTDGDNFGKNYKYLKYQK